MLEFLEVLAELFVPCLRSKGPRSYTGEFNEVLAELVIPYLGSQGPWFHT